MRWPWQREPQSVIPVKEPDALAPTCPHCGRRMQHNTAIKLETVRQYLCGCRGIVYYKNVIVPPKKTEMNRHGDNG
jgi:hypothetical protein